MPGATHAAALAMFREYSKYPPNSRPVDDSHSDVAEPLTIAASAQPLLRSDAAGKKVGSGVFCWMQPALNQVSRGQVQRLTLRCLRGLERATPAATGLPLVIESVEAEVLGAAGPAPIPLGGLRFVDDGSNGDEAAGDGTYTANLPIVEQVPGLVDLVARVRLANREADDPLDAQALSAHFSISALPPARFVERVSDRLGDGSLIVTVGLQVEKPGRYRVFANLEHDGELLAYAKEDRDLEAGLQQIELLFFGKILHDSGIDGSFDVTQLRGQRFNLDGNESGSLSEPLLPVERAHRTAAYRAADFSPDEWTSPYKEERINELTALAEREGD
ncbi:MAG TPA: choice-of-anchor X domain-containing protein [Polyangiaceae bacterium]|nr:choice-of-anchor X domain-containing protein [Polyangiaceae bacterium]